MFESKYSKVLTIILVIVIIAIIGLLAFLGFDYYQKYYITKQATDFVESFQGDITTGEQNNTEEETTVDENETGDGLQSTPSTSTTGTSTSTKKTYQGFTVAGTMKIPTINFEYPILEEMTPKALETGVVIYYPSGDNLNLPGNMVIGGHNYRNGLFFSNLKKLNNGDKIYVTDFRGKSLTYEVYNKFETVSTDTSFYTRDTNGLAELTLSTCTDASNDQRTIIFARQI
jgi:LPXTG-site transpeptidase (sortase) family protein